MRRLILLVLVAAIFVAHVFLWASDMQISFKVLFTCINVVGWTIVLAPILLIDRWLEAVQQRNRAVGKGDETAGSGGSVK